MSRNDKKFVLACVFMCFVCFNVKICGSTQQCCSSNSSLSRNSSICTDGTKTRLICENGWFVLDPNTNPDDKFFVDNDGFLILDGETIPQDKFCLSKLIEKNGSVEYPEVVAAMCFENDSHSLLHQILIIFSTIFLLLTLLVYLTLKNLRDLQGKCIMAFVSCLAASYTILLIVQTITESSYKVCILQGALLYFFFTATFFWNNVINFIMWYKIRYPFSKLENKRFCTLYMYGWGFGVPLLMVGLSFLLEYIPSGYHIRPNFGEICFFGNVVSNWAYFYGPVSVLLVMNVIFFVLSFLILSRSYSKPSNSRKQSLKYKFAMYLKLFIIMGVTWCFEIISFATKNLSTFKYIWFFTDCLNCSQGIFIFLVLVVFRQKVKRGLAENNACNIPWPRSWTNIKMEESSILSGGDEVELGNQKH